MPARPDARDGQVWSAATISGAEDPGRGGVLTRALMRAMYPRSRLGARPIIGRRRHCCPERCIARDSAMEPWSCLPTWWRRWWFCVSRWRSRGLGSPWLLRPTPAAFCLGVPLVRCGPLISTWCCSSRTHPPTTAVPIIGILLDPRAYPARGSVFTGLSWSALPDPEGSRGVFSMLDSRLRDLSRP